MARVTMDNRISRIWIKARSKRNTSSSLRPSGYRSLQTWTYSRRWLVIFGAWMRNTTLSLTKMESMFNLTKESRFSQWTSTLRHQVQSLQDKLLNLLSSILAEGKTTMICLMPSNWWRRRNWKTLMSNLDIFINLP